MNELVL